MAPALVHVRQEDGVAWLTLQRPKANALSVELVREIRDSVVAAEADPSVGCVVVYGGEGRFFSGGADIPAIREVLGGDPFAEGALLAEGLTMILAIERCAKPVIAAVNGIALGGGCELALACHLRIASEEARFGQPEINLGIMPGWGGTFRLARCIGYARALDWALTGRIVSADEAFAAGLLHRVVPSGELLAAAEELATTLAAKSPVAVRAILETARDQALLPGEAEAIEAQGFRRCTASNDAFEGITAFLEKRTPNFTGE